MSNLYAVETRHYAQRGSSEWVTTFVVAGNEEKLVQWIDERYYLGLDEEDWAEEGFHEAEITKEYQKANPGWEKRGKLLGVDYFVEEWGALYARGPGNRVIRFMRSNEHEELRDLYYGGTQVRWSKRRNNLTPRHLMVLAELGIAETLS